MAIARMLHYFSGQKPDIYSCNSYVRSWLPHFFAEIRTIFVCQIYVLIHSVNEACI